MDSYKTLNELRNKFNLKVIYTREELCHEFYELDGKNDNYLLH